MGTKEDVNEYAALHRKLMLDKFPRRLVLNKPASLPELAGAAFQEEAAGTFDVILAFVFSLEEMEERIRGVEAARLLADGGYLYLAYPKKGNKAYPLHIHRDSILPRLNVDEGDGLVPGTALKFSKMVALNDTFTIVGLKRIPVKERAKAEAAREKKEQSPSLS